VDDVRLLELSLGRGTKEVQENEKETVILQRRSIRVTKNVKSGEILDRNFIQFQRPCPPDAISINQIDDLIGKEIIQSLDSGDYIRGSHIKW